MDGLFTFAGAHRPHPAVDEWFASEPQALFMLARRWFTAFRDCGADVDELLHDGCPVACIEGTAFGYVNVFKTHVNVGFFNGKALPDPQGLLQGSGKRMRHVKVRPGEDIDVLALGKLIELSYADMKARLC